MRATHLICQGAPGHPMILLLLPLPCSVVLPEHDLLERYRPLRNDEVCMWLACKEYSLQDLCMEPPICLKLLSCGMGQMPGASLLIDKEFLFSTQLQWHLNCATRFLTNSLYTHIHTHALTQTLPTQTLSPHTYAHTLTQEAEHLWKKWFTTMATSCLHGPNCNIRKGGGHCYSGSRIYFKHMVYGERCKGGLKSGALN
eukprot:1138300-Pelagomonas_calceolata.AAC.10